MDRFYIRFAVVVAVVLLLLGTSVGEEVDDGNEKLSSFEVPNSPTDFNDTSEMNRTIHNPTNSSSMMGKPGPPPPLLPTLIPLNGTLNTTDFRPPPPITQVDGRLNSPSSHTPLNGTLKSPPSPSIPPSNATLNSSILPLSPPLSNGILNSPPPLTPLNSKPVMPRPVKNRTFESNKTDGLPKCSKLNATNCFDGGLVACLWHSQDGSKKLFIILENRGKSRNVTIVTQSITKYKFLSENSFNKFEISSAVNSPVVLNFKNNNCTINPTSDLHFQQASPSSQFSFTIPPIYTLQPSPIYFAYVFFLISLISVGACVCCRFCRGSRNTDVGIPYQQLEMEALQTQTVTSLVSDIEAPSSQQHGWDQWEDDWEEEEEITSNPQQKKPNEHTTTNTTTKDGWEDWDD
ncbi:hypothetical protein ZOSMA_26G00820 [Zostera marina]|uniref:DUF7356 domain-containing protein n=1 Tax=Zostera marina TaxID=29655 RepID=A0A0K9PE42_ZOSMR|nr:hypothetical protein ZOSMA_26G00820 [Zostera marina]